MDTGPAVAGAILLQGGLSRRRVKASCPTGRTKDVTGKGNPVTGRGEELTGRVPTLTGRGAGATGSTHTAAGRVATFCGPELKRHVEYGMTNIQYRISNIEYPVSNIRYRISGIQYPTSNIQYPRLTVGQGMTINDYRFENSEEKQNKSEVRSPKLVAWRPGTFPLLVRRGCDGLSVGRGGRFHLQSDTISVLNREMNKIQDTGKKQNKLIEQSPGLTASDPLCVPLIGGESSVRGRRRGIKIIAKKEKEQIINKVSILSPFGGVGGGFVANILKLIAYET